MAAYIGQIFMALLFVSLQRIRCSPDDPSPNRNDCDAQPPTCSGSNITACCSRAHQVYEQPRQHFSFNQCVGLNYDFSSFFRQEYYVHYAMRLPNPVLFARNRVCALHNVCMSGSGEVGSPLRVTFYSPPGGEMVGVGFNVDVVFESAPSNPRVWHDGTTFYQIPGHADDNFGHVVLNELLSAFTAMEMLGVGNYSHGRFLSNYDMKLPSSKWILPMFARAPFIARDLNVGHCFETLVVGHVLAYGDASFLALRGAVAQRFREYYARAIMCGPRGETDFSATEMCTGSKPLLKGKQLDGHKINLYKKVGGSNGPVWDHLCSSLMMEGIRAAIPDVQLQCLEMSSLSMQQQVQLVGQASVHVCAHGGLSYLSLFAHEGASLVLLVDDNCEALNLDPIHCSPKDTHILPYMPWLTVSYLSRAHEELFLAWLVQALRAASFRMKLPQPRFSAHLLNALPN